MSAESLNRTSKDIKIPEVDLDVLSKQKSDQIKPKRTCIKALNQRLYAEQRKDRFKNTAIICVIILSVGLFGIIIT